MYRFSFLALAACKVLPPPPVMAPHVPTAPEERQATTAMVVVGAAGEILGGGGWGVALRVEHQETERTTIGVELTGGRGDRGAWADRTSFRHYLVAVRGYGRYARIDEIALTYGAGLSWMRTGMITGSLQGAFAVSFPNDYVVPLGQVGFALAAPLRKGRAFMDEPFHIAMGPPEPGLPPPPRTEAKLPTWDAFLTFDVGLIVPIGETGNRLSLDVGMAKALRANQGLASFSLADSQR